MLKAHSCEKLPYQHITPVNVFLTRLNPILTMYPNPCLKSSFLWRTSNQIKRLTMESDETFSPEHNDSVEKNVLSHGTCCSFSVSPRNLLQFDP
ncbi:hypothetical protein TNCV_1780501 [Trichonephila clavipes]|nr:hypothetical protein TNCV_1780501 [Trichonephila clavipes]